MEREYYILWYKLDDKDYYLIWFSTENQDGVFVNNKNTVPSFDSVEALRNYAEYNEIELKDEKPNIIDIDIVQNWLKEKRTIIKDYNPFLDVWNLFEDISKSVNADFHKSGNYDIYDRIFWGCNIPAVTPEGESFTPRWTKQELKIIQEIFIAGLQFFKEKLESN